MTGLKLTREQRRHLFDLEPIPITGEGTCPVAQGDTIQVSSRMSLVVLAVRRRRKGGWALHYLLDDRRDPRRLLKRVPRVQDFQAIRDSFDADGYPAAPTRDVLEQAARESAYTSMPTSLADAGEAVDEATQSRLTKEAKTADHLRDQKRRERFEKRGTLERLAAAKAEAVARSVDISHHERVIEDRLDRIERQLGKGKAA